MSRSKRSKLTATFTTDFQHEFRAETGALLRKRLLWFMAIVGGISLLIIVTSWVAHVSSGADTGGPGAIEQGEGSPRFEIAKTGVQVGVLGLYAVALVYALRRKRRHAELLRLSQWLIFLHGFILLADHYVLQTGTISGLFLNITLIHVIACFVFPWSAWQALRPMLGILGLNVVGAVVEAILDKGDGLASVVAVSLSPMVAVPGTIICAIRHSRRVQSFRFRHVLDRYGDLRRELTDARRIHEGLFPAPIEDGDIRFTYMYEPMRQIGGDYLFAHAPRSVGGDAARLSVVLTDVTGHGIAAALTVNRIHGELERVFAEDPGAAPGDVLSLLNRYVHLTLARHSVYMTAFCMRVDPDAGTLEYASGGHPPAFVRAVNGSIEELQSTSFVLGACAADDFDPGARTIRFTAGDALIAYTDGATEARGHDGRMLGIVGIQRLLAGSGPRHGQSWVEHLLHAVEDFRDGPPADDTLVVQIEHAGRPRKVVATEAETPETVTN